MSIYIYLIMLKETKHPALQLYINRFSFTFLLQKPLAVLFVRL